MIVWRVDAKGRLTLFRATTGLSLPSGGASARMSSESLPLQREIDPFPLGPSLDDDRTREGRHPGQAAIAEAIVPVLLIA
jgi:hypothetical protein